MDLGARRLALGGLRDVRHERHDAVRRHRHFRGVEPVQLDRIALRTLGDREHLSRAPGGTGHDRLERQPVEQAHHVWVPLEVKVVQGDDRGTAPAKR